MDTQTLTLIDVAWPREMQVISDDKTARELPLPALEWPQDLFADEAPSN